MSRSRSILILVALMALIVVSANVLVQYPINNWLTWGAITYPVSYLVTDLTNRRFGPRQARRVVWVGFVVAVIMSAWLATPRIAAASGTAFLVSQLMDVGIFNRLRRPRWWVPPLLSSTLGSAVDTLLFFALAFYATGVPWVTLGIGDYGVKVAMAMLLLVPYGIGIRRWRQAGQP